MFAPVGQAPEPRRQRPLNWSGSSNLTRKRWRRFEPRHYNLNEAHTSTVRTFTRKRRLQRLSILAMLAGKASIHEHHPLLLRRSPRMRWVRTDEAIGRTAAA